MSQWNEIGMSLPDIRKAAGKSQRDVAAAMGVSQPNVSEFERRNDVRLLTLRRFIEALGGDLEVLVVLDGLRVRLPF